MADYRALAQALDPYAMDTGGITPDTIKALQTINKSPNLLGMIADIGRGGLSNLESLVRGGVAQFGGTPVDTLNTIRTPYPMEVMGDVNYAPDKQVYGGTKDILGMMPKRVTQARPETAGMEELGTIVGPGLAKAAMPAVRAGQKGLNLLGMEMADRVATGQSVLPSLLKEPQSAMFAVNPADQMAQAVTKAEVSPLGFYSAVEQQALKIPRKQGTGDSFLNDLMKGQDVKKYEIEAMGLEDYLRGKPNVTRQEVQDFITNNKINVEERQLGENIAQDPIGIAKRKEIFDRYEPQIQALNNEKVQYATNIVNARNLANKNYAEANAALNREGNPQPIPTTEDWNKYNLAKAELERMNKIPLDTREFERTIDALRNARDAEANAAYVVPEPTPTKYEKYQLAGGENYRELLLKLPEQNITEQSWQVLKPDGTTTTGYFTSEEAARRNANYIGGTIRQAAPVNYTTGYRSSHWSDPNVLTHIRVNDRIDAEGKKMLLIEEVQSDWHQAGREQGYKNPEAKKALEVESKNIANERNSLVAELSKQEQENGFVSIEGQQRWDKFKEKEDAFKQKSKDFSSQVPDAPFKDTWYQLALKRAIKEAVDKGYDRIGLTTGAQQASRYDLSKQVDELNYKRNDDGTYQLSAQANGRGNMLGETVPEEKLSDYVGKEVAEKITKNEGFDRNFGGTGSVSQPKDIWKGLSGLDLKIGGEGMKKYYDEIYPNFLNKYGKKYGAQVGETKVNTIKERAENSMIPASKQETVRYLDITPEMRKAVKEGQPLASIEEELAKALA